MAEALNQLAHVLVDALAALPSKRLALAGGIAVSTRTVPRFTGDVDLVVAVADDSEAERVIHALISAGYQVLATLEQTKQGRLATARLKRPGADALVDLLFASTGIETEIVNSATIETVFGISIPVARTGHLIAMKLLARDDVTRPLDRADLVELAKVASEDDWSLATTAVELIVKRGFARGRDLRSALDEWRR